MNKVGTVGTSHRDPLIRCRSKSSSVQGCSDEAQLASLVADLAGNVGIKNRIVETILMRDEYLATKLAVAVARWLRHHETTQRPTDHRKTEHSQRQRNRSFVAPGVPSTTRRDTRSD